MIRQKLDMPVGQTSRYRYGNLRIYNEGYILKVCLADSIPGVDKNLIETPVCTLTQKNAQQLIDYLQTAISQMSDKPTW